MKNIHLIPTDKPSRLAYVINTEKSTLTLFEDEMEKSKRFFPQNIYITSDEQGFKGDWVIHIPTGKIIKVKESVRKADFKKVILTTDQDLIADGVQAIDDEFLEWFVKNHNCEFVETKRIIKEYVDDQDAYGYDVNYYKIIIPKEEPKQETLEEVSERLFPINGNDESLDYVNKIRKSNWLSGAVFGAKWQQQQNKNLYSEEEVYQILSKFRELRLIEFQEWFEQFKKK